MLPLAAAPLAAIARLSTRATLCTGANPFGSISMAAFTAKFLISNYEVLTNKRQRFTSFLNATAGGTLFSRPPVNPAYVAHLTYHPPMWGVLQSSNDDVEAELNVMRNAHLDRRFRGTLWHCSTPAMPTSRGECHSSEVRVRLSQSKLFIVV